MRVWELLVRGDLGVYWPCDDDWSWSKDDDITDNRYLFSIFSYERLRIFYCVEVQDTKGERMDCMEIKLFWTGMESLETVAVVIEEGELLKGFLLKLVLEGWRLLLLLLMLRFVVLVYFIIYVVAFVYFDTLIYDSPLSSYLTPFSLRLDCISTDCSISYSVKFIDISDYDVVTLLLILVFLYIKMLFFCSITVSLLFWCGFSFYNRCENSWAFDNYKFSLRFGWDWEYLLIVSCAWLKLINMFSCCFFWKLWSLLVATFFALINWSPNYFRSLAFYSWNPSNSLTLSFTLPTHSFNSYTP